MSRKGQQEPKSGKNQSLAPICGVSDDFKVKKNKLVMDSGGTDHIAFDKNLFVDFCEKNEVVLIESQCRTIANKGSR